MDGFKFDQSVIFSKNATIKGNFDATDAVIIGVSLNNLNNTDVSSPSIGDYLKYNGSTWIKSPAPRIGYQLQEDQFIITETTWEDISNFTWIDSRYNTYSNGIILLEAVIVDRNLDIRLRDMTNAVSLGSSSVSSSGFYTFYVSNPLTNSRLQLQVKKSTAGGINPQLFGIKLEYDQ